MATGYRYRPLDPERKEVRIIGFARQDHGPNTPLQCSIQHVSLDTQPPPPYYAVSYTWGDASRRRDIIIDGQCASVLENPEIASRHLHLDGKWQRGVRERLRRICERLVSGEICWLWLDAVCVNQQYLEERSHQVSIMFSVYSEAKAVLIWHGEDVNKQAKTAFRAFRTSHERIQGHKVRVIAHGIAMLLSNDKRTQSGLQLG